jgi:hypothetical protein
MLNSVRLRQRRTGPLSFTPPFGLPLPDQKLATRLGAKLHTMRKIARIGPVWRGPGQNRVT